MVRSSNLNAQPTRQSARRASKRTAAPPVYPTASPTGTSTTPSGAASPSRDAKLIQKPQRRLTAKVLSYDGDEGDGDLTWASALYVGALGLANLDLAPGSLVQVGLEPDGEHFDRRAIAQLVVNERIESEHGKAICKCAIAQVQLEVQVSQRAAYSQDWMKYGDEVVVLPSVNVSAAKVEEAHIILDTTTMPAAGKIHKALCNIMH